MTELASISLAFILLTGIGLATVSAHMLATTRRQCVLPDAEPDHLLAMGLVNAAIFVVWIVVVYLLAGIGAACMTAAGGILLLLPTEAHREVYQAIRRFGILRFGRLSLAVEGTAMLLAVAIFLVAAGQSTV